MVPIIDLTQAITSTELPRMTHRVIVALTETNQRCQKPLFVFANVLASRIAELNHRLAELRSR